MPSVLLTNLTPQELYQSIAEIDAAKLQRNPQYARQYLLSLFQVRHNRKRHVFFRKFAVSNSRTIGRMAAQHRVSNIL